MTAAAPAETRTCHRVTRVRVAPVPAPRSLSRQVHDNGLPSSIVSDRGSQFTSDFWKRVTEARDITQPQPCLPPTNGRTNGKSQCHPRAVSPGILQLPAGRLGQVVANCRILLQQHTNQNHKNNPLLCQLWISPSFPARPRHVERRDPRSVGICRGIKKVA